MRLDHDFQVRDQVLLRNNQEFKYEKPYKVPYTIMQMWTNGMVTLLVGATMG